MESVIEFFSEATGWNWLIAAAVLFALDVLAPGFFLIWFAVAAAAVGMVLFAVPMDMQWQILAFCAFSVVSVMAGRVLWGSDRTGVTDKPLLNQRARQLIGRTFSLATPIRGGQGRITAGDSQWSVRGPDMPSGALVKVTEADGTVLIVEAAD